MTTTPIYEKLSQLMVNSPYERNVLICEKRSDAFHFFATSLCNRFNRWRVCEKSANYRMLLIVRSESHLNMLVIGLLRFIIDLQSNQKAKLAVDVLENKHIVVITVNGKRRFFVQIELYNELCEIVKPDVVMFDNLAGLSIPDEWFKKHSVRIIALYVLNDPDASDEEAICVRENFVPFKCAITSSDDDADEEAVLVDFDVFVGRINFCTE